MTKASNLADIPAPAGATHVVDDWYDVDSPDAARYFTGGEWVVTEPTPNTPTSPCKSTAPSTATARLRFIRIVEDGTELLIG